MSDLEQVRTDTDHQPSHLGWWILLAVAIAYAWWILQPNIQGSKRLPALKVEGWTNLNLASNEVIEPTRKSVTGKYVVVDAWATWCPPCRRKMPDLARLYANWKSEGVVFLGITPETSREMASIDGFAATVEGFDWPIGYGGGQILNSLRVEMFPTLMLFDPEGKELWRGHRTGELEVELARYVGKES